LAAFSEQTASVKGMKDIAKAVKIILGATVRKSLVQLNDHNIGIIFGKGVDWSCLQVGLEIDQHGDDL
jgi:hypothetical protein